MTNALLLTTIYPYFMVEWSCPSHFASLGKIWPFLENILFEKVHFFVSYKENHTSLIPIEDFCLSAHPSIKGVFIFSTQEQHL